MITAQPRSVKLSRSGQILAREVTAYLGAWAIIRPCPFMNDGRGHYAPTCPWCIRVEYGLDPK